MTFNFRKTIRVYRKRNKKEDELKIIRLRDTYTGTRFCSRAIAIEV